MHSIMFHTAKCWILCCNWVGNAG